MEQSESGNQKAEYEETRMQCEAAPPLFWCISRMHSACLDSCGIADEQIDNTHHVYMAWSWDIVKIFFPALLYLGFWKLFNCFI